MAAVLGFAGVNVDGATVRINPSLPQHWQAVELPIVLRGETFRLRISRDEVTVSAAAANSSPVLFTVQDREEEACPPGGVLRLALTTALI
ncbi:glycosyl hydrolase family 65 protein [Paenibacillus donghaensis]|uniref:glycosyl hydrolase family 65 protein n=1 Tax=Paenibacillus donghaensis TaxID=414771 RepID=UPI001FE7F7C8|nr:glycosyl hydrolase family 65 protein [Paenibacillus donghaensis]